jgi:hypothetical protein
VLKHGEEKKKKRQKKGVRAKVLPKLFLGSAYGGAGFR